MAKLKHVLLVDDDETSNFIIEKVFELFDVCEKLSIMSNGLEAAEFFKKCNGTFPSLVLLDINMPLMDGFEFLDWFSSNGLGGKTRFVIYSTSDNSSDRQKASGYPDVVDYIIKPISKTKIDRVISSSKAP